MRSAALNPTGQAVYATVAYADLYNLPIHVDALHCALIETSMSLLDMLIAVDDLVQKGHLEQQDDLVYLPGRKSVLDEHARRSATATAAWATAETWSRRIGRVPLVRMVAVVGELATFGVPSEPAGPIPLIVVVRPRRVWIARSMIETACRFSGWRNPKICVRYVTATRAPEIAHHGLATAWDLAHMAVTVGHDVSRTIRRSNAWMFDWLPNATFDGNVDHLTELTPSSTQKWIEWFLLLPISRPFENWTRKRQMSRLTDQVRQVDDACGADIVLSADTCDAGFTASNVTIESAWAAWIVRNRQSPGPTSL